MNIYLKMFVVALLSMLAAGTAQADDLATLKQRVAKRICIRPMPLYAVETYAQVCGEPDTSSFNKSVIWGRCANKVNDDNEVIGAYNNFVIKECKKSDSTPSFADTHPQTGRTVHPSASPSLSAQDRAAERSDNGRKIVSQAEFNKLRSDCHSHTSFDLA